MKACIASESSFYYALGPAGQLAHRGRSAAKVVERAALAEAIAGQPIKPVLHGDNGAILKATTVLGMLNWLGIKPLYSRPRVSDDNAFAEALFKSAKYRPEYPKRGFADLEEARRWEAAFVLWYDHEHRHSGIHYVTPAERHDGRDRTALEARKAFYTRAKGPLPESPERPCHPELGPS